MSDNLVLGLLFVRLAAHVAARQLRFRGLVGPPLKAAALLLRLPLMGLKNLAVLVKDLRSVSLSLRLSLISLSLPFSVSFSLLDEKMLNLVGVTFPVAGFVYIYMCVCIYLCVFTSQLVVAGEEGFI